MPNVVEHVHYRNEMMAWQRRHDASAPKVGDLAPDFELGASQGDTSVRLSSFRGERPVALLFGSFT